MRSLIDTIYPAKTYFPIWQPPHISDEYETENCRGSVECKIKYKDLIDMYNQLNLNTLSGTLYVHQPENYKYSILLPAGMNGCEITAILGLYYFVKYMLESNEAGFKWIRENCQVQIMPCISPDSFDACRYNNVNGVNINRNFDYNGSWFACPSNKGTWNYKGIQPLSESETSMLYDWLNANHGADLYIDCHTDVTRKGCTPLERTFEAIVSNDELKNKVLNVQGILYQIYCRELLNPTKPFAVIPEPTSYPKTFVCQNHFNIPNIMIEQHAADKGHGGNGKVCSDADLRNYVTLLRAYIIACVNKD